ncbi:MAG: Tex family protein, partial [Firmicutes bacterium]|nr:Tex family protein [Bacillota bacterium]
MREGLSIDKPHEHGESGVAVNVGAMGDVPGDAGAADARIAARIATQISQELKIARPKVESVIRLLDEGNTIPFLARYRKEQTGGLDEEAIRSIDERLDYLRNLETRKLEVVRLIDEQGVLTPEIRQSLEAAETLQRVEDIYRPFRPKRRTRASMARERGLEPLAQWLISRPEDGYPVEEAHGYVNPEAEVNSPEEALAGARDIVAEMIADDPEVRAWARQWTTNHGQVRTEATADPEARTPYEQYYDYSEPVSRIPPHRVLAINRGEREKTLRVRIALEAEPILAYLERRLTREGAESSPADSELALAAEDAYSRLLGPAVERDVRNALTEKAEQQAIKVFGANLKALLLTPPIRGKVVLGLDPAYRTGCKIAVVDATGKLLETAVVYPTPPQRRVDEAERMLLQMIHRHEVDLIAIGNGTASREAEAFVAGLIPKSERALSYVVVNEAGASVYSASKVAREEFPDLDVSERSAVSIARRLQDPLAELVKIEPRSIGVGQYQHDVAGKELTGILSGVVESAVNCVGVDLNTASVPLLSYVAGISPSVASNIVAKRESDGPFSKRRELRSVSRLGPKTFQQCAGFLRVPGGEHPLDNTPIHPESYSVAERLLEELGFSVEDVAGGKRAELCGMLGTVDARQWAQHLDVGLPTLEDIVEALGRPGRDPRDEFPQPILRKDVLTMDDLRPGMILEGTVRNVVDFGAFVDIGVQQDGLVHISELSDRYVRHPLDEVSVGDIVQVRVLSVDLERSRIALSMR